MNKRFLTYFILALVVFQSAVATADAHQSHQSGTEHISFEEHVHEYEDVEIVQSNASQSLEMDCHHCCHCHGHFCPAALFKPGLTFALNNPSLTVSDYSETFPSEFIHPFLRPPIPHLI